MTDHRLLLLPARFLVALALLMALAGCSNGNGSSNGDGGSGCKAAGGTCRPGGLICYGTTPADDDCNPDTNPGGAFCCVGTACEAGKSPLSDGGCGEPDGSGCAAKGGTCESSSASCAQSLGTMDCNIGTMLPGDVQCCTD